jgi:hypothetical protein
MAVCPNPYSRPDNAIARIPVVKPYDGSNYFRVVVHSEIGVPQTASAETYTLDIRLQLFPSLMISNCFHFT